MPNIVKIYYNNTEPLEIPPNKVISLDINEKFISENIYIENVIYVYLNVTSNIETTISATNGSLTVYATKVEDVYRLKIPEIGIWTVSNGFGDSIQVIIENLFINYSVTLNHE